MAATTQPPQLFQGIARQSAGYKLLASMGWKEGEGLGASKQGIKEHVKVKKKQDAQGIGAFEAHHSRDWAVGMVSFDRILAGLKEVKASSKMAEEEQDDQEDKEEPPAAALTGKKLKKHQKQQQQEQAQRSKKQKRKAADGSDSDDSDAARRASGAAAGTSSPSSSEAAQPAAAGQQGLAPKRVKLATHLGRYGKRERAKFVKNYSEQDLKMILGAVPGAIPGVDEADVPGPNGMPAAAAGPADVGFWPVLAEIKARPASGSSSDSDAEDVARPPTPRLQSEARSPPDGEHHAKAGGCSGSGTKDSETTKTTFWWSSMFVRAGRMGSIRQELKSHTVRAAAEGLAGAGKAPGSIQVHGFKEEDQTKLYEQVQNNATTGKQGLGRSSAPKKVAGARWCGTKTKIVDSDEEEEEKQEEQEAGEANGSASEEEAEATTVVVMAPKHVQQQQRQQQEKAQQQQGCEAAKDGGNKRSKAAPATDDQAVAATDGGKIKWQKLVEQILRDAPKRRLKLKKLQKKALSAAGLGAGATADNADAAVRSMLRKIRKSGKFQTCEKWVSLL